MVPHINERMSEALRQKQARVRELRERALRKRAMTTPTSPDVSSPPTAPVTPDHGVRTEASHQDEAGIFVPAVTGSSVAGLVPGMKSTMEEADSCHQESLTLSKSKAIRQRLRKQEAQLAMLKRRTCQRQSLEESTTTTALYVPPGKVSDMNERTKDLLLMTAKKKKDVAGRKRQLSHNELQLETIKAIETATARLETLV